MLVCVDTNVMLNAFSRSSPLVPLFQAIKTGTLRLAVSTSVVLEYEEVFSRRGGVAFASKVMDLLTLVSQAHGRILQVHPAFQFRVVTADPDDNKFTDCAISAGADYLITDDTHFAPLANAGYKSQPITPMEFIQRHLSGA